MIGSFAHRKIEERERSAPSDVTHKTKHHSKLSGPINLGKVVHPTCLLSESKAAHSASHCKKLSSDISQRTVVKLHCTPASKKKTSRTNITEEKQTKMFLFLQTLARLK